MGAFNNLKNMGSKLKDKVTPKFLKKDIKPISANDQMIANMSEYSKALDASPLQIDESGVTRSLLGTLGITATLPRPVLVLRGIKTDHKLVEKGKTLLAYNFRKLLDKYEPKFIMRINLSNFMDYSISLLAKDKRVISKIAYNDNKGVVTITDDTMFISITKEN